MSSLTRYPLFATQQDLKANVCRKSTSGFGMRCEKLLLEGNVPFVVSMVVNFKMSRN